MCVCCLLYTSLPRSRWPGTGIRGNCRLAPNRHTAKGVVCFGCALALSRVIRSFLIKLIQSMTNFDKKSPGPNPYFHQHTTTFQSPIHQPPLPPTTCMDSLPILQPTTPDWTPKFTPKNTRTICQPFILLCSKSECESDWRRRRRRWWQQQEQKQGAFSPTCGWRLVWKINIKSNGEDWLTGWLRGWRFGIVCGWRWSSCHCW